MGFVESRMRWKSHVRFGKRAEETDQLQDRRRASVRLHRGSSWMVDVAARWRQPKGDGGARRRLHLVIP
jgi:hypothetical protein